MTGLAYLLAKDVERVRAIAEDVAGEAGVSLDALFGPSRKRPLVKIRQHAIWLAHRETTASLGQIGRVFNRDHTTVLHAIRACEMRIAEEGKDNGR